MPDDVVCTHCGAVQLLLLDTCVVCGELTEEVCEDPHCVCHLVLEEDEA
jgi:hypothetical protein